MKKTLCILIAVILILCLAGCSGSNVKAAEKAIADIGEVSSGSGEQIAAAREAFDNLSGKEKAKIGSADALARAEADYAKICAEEAITGLSKAGTVSRQKLEEALEAYYRLDPELRAQVDGVALEDALQILRTEEAIASFGQIGPDSKERLEQVEAMYNALGPELRDKVENAGRLEELQQIMDAVEAIELLPVTPPYDAVDVAGAQKLYNALGPELQAEVTNSAKLKSALEYRELQEQKEEQDNSEIYLKACDHMDRYEMTEALEYLRQLPEDFRDTAKKISSAEGYLAWAQARTDVQAKWVWDEKQAVGSDGSKYSADYKSLTIKETEDPGEFAEVNFREQRLFYVQIDTERPEMAQFMQSVLSRMPDLQKASFTASNCMNSSGGLSIDCEAKNGTLLALYSSDEATTLSTYASTGSMYQKRTVNIYLQDDGRLRLECYITVFDGEADAKNTPTFNEHLTFYYDKAE